MPRNLREALRGKLTEDELRELRAFDMIGDIAVVKLSKRLLPKKNIIGEALMEVHRNIRTVLNQTTPVLGEFRTRALEVIAGEARTETVHREGGCRFKVDLAKVYFSPRLGTERLRIARLIAPGETVTNLFAGVGCYSIIIAHHSEATRVYSIDKNPDAFKYMVENIRINKVGDRVVPILGDSRKVVDRELFGKADRVLMPLPEFSHDFFDVAVRALKPSGGVIHFYDFGEEPDVFGPALDFAKSAALSMGFDVNLLHARKIRSYATRCYHVVLDLLISPGLKI